MTKQEHARAVIDAALEELCKTRPRLKVPDASRDEIAALAAAQVSNTAMLAVVEEGLDPFLDALHFVSDSHGNLFLMLD